MLPSAVTKGSVHGKRSETRSLAFFPRLALVPVVGVLRKTRALNSDDAEPLTRGRLHYHPTLQAIHNLGAQRLQAQHFGRDVIGLDVYVDPALVVHALDLHDRLIGRGLQHEVIAATARMLGINWATQRPAPEVGGLVNIGSLAVD